MLSRVSLRKAPPTPSFSSTSLGSTLLPPVSPPLPPHNLPCYPPPPPPHTPAGSEGKVQNGGREGAGGHISVSIGLRGGGPLAPGGAREGRQSPPKPRADCPKRRPGEGGAHRPNPLPPPPATRGCVHGNARATWSAGGSLCATPVPSSPRTPRPRLSGDRDLYRGEGSEAKKKILCTHNRPSISGPFDKFHFFPEEKFSDVGA